MRLTITCLALLFLVSCNGNKQKEKQPANGVTTTPDSALIVRPEMALNTYAQVDRSPMDMSYFPADYPLLKMTGTAPASPKARVIYSRPYLHGRSLFTNVLKYGEAWRLGANEATELHLFAPVTIAGKKINPGRYVLYCIPQPESWTIALNRNTDSWGLHPDSTKDVARFTIPVRQTTSYFEFFTIVFKKTAEGADLVMAWERLEARLPLRF